MVDPEVIIFSGGMSRAGEKLLSRVRENISTRAWTCLPQDTPLVVASVEHAGSIGGAVVSDKLRHKEPSLSEQYVSNSFEPSKINLAICLGTGFLSILLRACKPESAGSRCPLFAGPLVAGSLPLISAYSGFMYWITRRS